MSSESFVRNILVGFCRTLFQVVAFGLGIVILFMGLGAFFSTPGVPHSTQAKVLPNDKWQVQPLSHEAPTILRIDISGVIGMKQMNQENVWKQLAESIDTELKTGQVRAVLLTINSPGGLADQSDGIYRTIQDYKKRYKIPVYAYVDGFCASGGMYIACAADKIFASEDSLIGHVGVLFSPPFFNVSHLMQRLGIESKSISAGKNKDSMNPFRPWKEGESENFQFIVNSMYERFVSIVSQNRPKLTTEILLDQGARIWPSKEAEEYGYIDGRLNSRDDMLQIVAKEAGIESNYQFVELETQNIFDILFGPRTGPLFGSNQVEHYLRLPGDLPPELTGKPLYLYHPN